MSYTFISFLQKEDGGKGKDIPIGIGEGSMIKKAIVDKNARVGKNVMVWYHASAIGIRKRLIITLITFF